MAFTTLIMPISRALIVFVVYLWLKCEVIRGQRARVSSILIFGDSTADSGNNNYIKTLCRSDFWPYGKDFRNHIPTGRFSNGRLASDFAADYLGLKESVPPYLDPTLTISDLITGVSFASAGSGFDPLTPTFINAMKLSTQLDHFREYKGKLEAAIGKEKTKEVISNAVFFISAGTNDFVINYFSLPFRRRNYTLPGYMNFVLDGALDFVQELVNEGGRRIGLVGLPPLGCLPFVITFNSHYPFLERRCNARFSSAARDFNRILLKGLNTMQLRVQASGARIAYLDAYTPLEEMVLGHKYDFKVVNRGCCGTGMAEMGYLCDALSVICDDARKYVFWDSVHPTEKAYELLFQSNLPSLEYLLGN